MPKGKETRRIKKMQSIDFIRSCESHKCWYACVDFVDGDDDDAEYFSDDDEDYNVDDEDDKSEEAKKKRESSRYKPRPDTKMYKYLEGIKD